MGIHEVVDRARRLESRVARALNRAAENVVGSEEREPLEIAHSIVDVVERQVQSGSRGTRLFPFNKLEVSVLAPTRDARVRFEALFAAPPVLRDRIVDRLRSMGCEANDLRVEVAYVARAGRGWENPLFNVAFDRVTAAAPLDAAGRTRARLELTIVRGMAERRSYSFMMPRIDLGRGVEVRDNRHRLLGTNHVAFVEGVDTVNQTVSRRHAHIALDPSGNHRLHDDRSEQGTGIVRGGRTIPVPAGARGVRLRSGDEIVLGEARLRLRLEESAS
jgi:hypothetical protein